MVLTLSLLSRCSLAALSLLYSNDCKMLKMRFVVCASTLGEHLVLAKVGTSLSRVEDDVLEHMS
jgi:hypothetical protein